MNFSKERILGYFRYKPKPRMKMTFQNENSECGLACLCMISNYYGACHDLIDLRRHLDMGSRGVSLKNLIHGFNQLGLKARPVKLDIDKLKYLNTPAVLHWDLKHYVVLSESNDKFSVVYDPSKGVLRVDNVEMSKHFTGVAVEIYDLGLLENLSLSKSFDMGDLKKIIFSFGKYLINILILSIILQFLIICMPVVVKYLLDGFHYGDYDYHILMFVVLVIIMMSLQGVVRYFRILCIQYLKFNLSIELTSYLYKKLVKLPVGWFEKRDISNILSKFDAVNEVNEVFSQKFCETLIDGLMSLVVLCFILYLSVDIALFCLFITVLMLILKSWIFPDICLKNNEFVESKIKCNSVFFDAIRNISDVKIYSGYDSSHARLMNFFSEKTCKERGLQRLKFVDDMFCFLLLGFEYAFVLLVGCYYVYINSISMGAFVSIVVLRGIFSANMSSLIDNIFSFKLMDVYFDKLRDLFYENDEKYLTSNKSFLSSDLVFSINLSGVSYRYDKFSNHIFRNLSIRIQEGECIAITSPTGCGKTTLIKIMMGLYQPTEGKVELGKYDIRDIGLNTYRSCISAVMQDCQLKSGSILDNIAFSTLAPDMDWVIECTKKACIYDEILEMPMKFNTYVGDMGCSLSGGQVQRVLLARALYKRPRVLFLDESSSFLDFDTEVKINHELKSLDMTRVVVAHRKETINMADRIVNLVDFKHA